jgi:hypothetical protein
VRTAWSVLRRGGLFAALGVLLLTPRSASADLTLLEHDGWTFFTDGRINSFFSAATGDDFPKRDPNDPTRVADPIGSGQQFFTAGFPNDQFFKQKYFGTRVRSGFLGSIIAFGVKKNVTEWTTVKSYISLWGTSESYARDRRNDFGDATSKGFDVREGWVSIDGPWGSFIAGRQSGILGGISTEIDFLYGHNFGVGLPCLEIYYPTCGHIGTGALGPGFAAGFSYLTPSLSGLRVKAALYDPVRLLGVWERVPYPRPEGAIMYERRVTPAFLFKLQFEGMYQYMGQIASDRHDSVYGLAGGGRFEIGPFRLGLSAFYGRGLGTYVALQNASSTFNGGSRNLRYFTGLYAQTAVVFGREQVSAGIGRVKDDLLPEDRTDLSTSNLKYQTGISGAFYHRLSENLVLGIDYFYFRTDWWGGAAFSIDPTTMAPVASGGLLPGEKQVVQLVNVGATFYW